MAIHRPELVIVRGLPGSGKSAIAKELVAEGFEHYEADMYFGVGGVYSFKATGLVHAHAWCRRRVNNAMERGARVVVAGTFVRIRDMSDYFILADQLGVPCRVIETSGAWIPIHDVPDEKVRAMRQQWEPFDGNYSADRFTVKPNLTSMFPEVL